MQTIHSKHDCTLFAHIHVYGVTFICYEYSDLNENMREYIPKFAHFMLPDVSEPIIFQS